MNNNELSIADIVGEENVDKVAEIYLTVADHQFVSVLVRDILAARMDEINRITGQENDARFLGYLIQMFMNQQKAKRLRSTLVN